MHTLIAGLFAAVAVPYDGPNDALGGGIVLRVAGGLAALGYATFWVTSALGPPPRGVADTKMPKYKQMGYGIGQMLTNAGLNYWFFSVSENTLRLALSFAFLVATLAVAIPINKWAQSRVAEVRSSEGPSPSVVGAPSGAPAAPPEADPEVCAAQDVVPDLKFTKEMANDRLRAPYRSMAVLIHAQVAIFIVYMLSLLSWFE